MMCRRLAQDRGFLAVELFFGEGAFIPELLKLAQLQDNPILGVGGWIVGWNATGVPVGVGGSPNEANDPGDAGPAKEKVYGEDAASAWMTAQRGNDGREKIENQADSADRKSENAVEKVKWKLEHSGNKFTVFLL